MPARKLLYIDVCRKINIIVKSNICTDKLRAIVLAWGGSYFLFEKQKHTRGTRLRSATKRFSFEFSSRSCRSSRNSFSPRPAYFFFHM